MSKTSHILVISCFVLLGCTDSDFSSGTNKFGGGSLGVPNKGRSNDSSRRSFQGPAQGNGQNGAGGIAENMGEITESCKILHETNLSISQVSPNMVPDGDFERGRSDIKSDYAYDDVSSCHDPEQVRPGHGSFTITNDPSRCHRHFDQTGPSNVAVFNGMAQRFWCRTFNVQPGRTYAFAVQSRLLNDGAGSPIHWKIDGEIVIPAISPTRQWRTRGALWESGTKTQIEVCGENDSTVKSGNDWAIDNICLVPQ